MIKINEHYYSEAAADAVVREANEVVKNLYPFKLEVLDEVGSPAYYHNPEAAREVRDVLERHSHALRTLAIAAKVVTTDSKNYGILKYEYYHVFKELAYAWVKNCNKKIKGWDTDFVVGSRFHGFVEAYAMFLDMGMALFGTFHRKFVTWLDEFYIPSCNKLAYGILHRWNNHASIGLMGLGLSAYVKGDDELGKKTETRLRNHYKFQRMKVPFISKHGELWKENLRTNMGMYYTYLSLAALWKTELWMQNLFTDNQRYLTGFWSNAQTNFHYAQNPLSWPYGRLKIWGIRHLFELIFPTRDELRILYNTGKAGCFYYVYGDYMNDSDMMNWIGDYIPTNESDMYPHAKLYNVFFK